MRSRDIITPIACPADKARGGDRMWYALVRDGIHTQYGVTIARPIEDAGHGHDHHIHAYSPVTEPTQGPVGDF